MNKVIFRADPVFEYKDYTIVSMLGQAHSGVSTFADECFGTDLSLKDSSASESQGVWMTKDAQKSSSIFLLKPPGWDSFEFSATETKQ